EKELFSNTRPKARYPSKTVGLLARMAIKFGMKPSDFCTFSSIGFDISGAVAMVTGAKSISSVVLTFLFLSGSMARSHWTKRLVILRATSGTLEANLFLFTDGAQKHARQPATDEWTEGRDRRITPVRSSFVCNGQNCMRKPWAEVPCGIDGVAC